MRILTILPAALVLIAISCGEPTPTPKSLPTPTETAAPSKIFELWEAMETLNNFYSENEKAIKRCLASQELDYSRLYRDLMPVYEIIEDDLKDGRLDEFPIEDVEQSVRNLTELMKSLEEGFAVGC